MPLSGRSGLFQTLPRLASLLRPCLTKTLFCPVQGLQPTGLRSFIHNISAAQDVAPSCTPSNVPRKVGLCTAHASSNLLVLHLNGLISVHDNVRRCLDALVYWTVLCVRVYYRALGIFSILYDVSRWQRFRKVEEDFCESGMYVAATSYTFAIPCIYWLWQYAFAAVQIAGEYSETVRRLWLAIGNGHNAHVAAQLIMSR